MIVVSAMITIAEGKGDERVPPGDGPTRQEPRDRPLAACRMNHLRAAGSAAGPRAQADSGRAG